MPVTFDATKEAIQRMCPRKEHFCDGKYMGEKGKDMGMCQHYRLIDSAGNRACRNPAHPKFVGRARHGAN